MEAIRKKTLFWDVESPDPEKDSDFIIGRILNFGDKEDFMWALEYYGSQKIKETILRGALPEGKSLSFWCQYFHINQSQCINRRSAAKHTAFWRRLQKAQ
ncbi:MAG: hypothetical protein HYV78_01555 [Candidatus Wildermuthbacteria bacterium]|nr:hypothetical protein [Candidatus Wildermuthbacteria bacterium]